MILVLATGALVSVIAVFWASVRTLVGETPLSGADAYALGAPRAEEEQKRAVLRALKDLEFERSVGKISDEDYEALVSKYRAEAKRLLRLLEENAQPGRREGGGARPRAPRARGPREDGPDPGAGPRLRGGRRGQSQGHEEEEGPAPPPLSSRAGAPQCLAPCGTTNDADAVFCKKCGARQGADKAGAGGDTARDEDAS